MDNAGGGAMRITDSNVTLKTVAFRDNSVVSTSDDAEGGGAIAVRGVDHGATVQLDGLVRFERNVASSEKRAGWHGAVGGAIHCAGGAVVRAVPQAPDGVAAIFGDGTASGGNFADGSGGGIGATNCRLELDDSLFLFNFAEQAGGAIYLHEERALEFEIGESVFFENRQISEGIGGGAIAISTDARLMSREIGIRSSVFMQNRAEGVDGGGAVHLDARALSTDPLRIEVLNSRFFRNIALASGGALYVDADHGVPVEFRIGCTAPLLSRDLPPDRYCIEFVENLAGHDGAAIRFIGRHADGSGIASTALLRNELVPVNPSPEGATALSFSINGAASVLELQQLRIDGNRGPGALGDMLGGAIAYGKGDTGVGGSIRVRRSTIRYPGRVFRTDADSEWENTLVIGDDLADIPVPGSRFSCSPTVADEAFPGLDLETTSRGQLRAMESSTLRGHGIERFAPCSQAQRMTGLPQTDLDGMPRPADANFDADPPDIGVFEHFRDGVFAHGFDDASR